MSKKSTFTTITPLPPGITREVVVQFLHNHQEMIDLNPLVIERHPIKPPPHATAEEYHCTWWSLTDKVSYLPGGMATGDITYTCAFHDLPTGLQTHCYAPMGTDIRDRWRVEGTLPGEPIQPIELGIGAPMHGLYIREDVELRCNFIMSSFVKKTLKKAHGALVDRLSMRAQIATAADLNQRMSIQRSATRDSVHSPGGSDRSNGGVAPSRTNYHQYSNSDSGFSMPITQYSPSSHAGNVWFSPPPQYQQMGRSPGPGANWEVDQSPGAPSAHVPDVVGLGLASVPYHVSGHHNRSGSMPAGPGRDAFGRVSWYALQNSSTAGATTQGQMQQQGQGWPSHTNSHLRDSNCMALTPLNPHRGSMSPPPQIPPLRLNEHDEKEGYNAYDPRTSGQQPANEEFLAELE